ncbi:MAG: SHOCT domain-containing protein [Ruminococcaceae bacterium]|nr:SHOCT domain-containing protein [Oscillospiraceae bacterium]
MFVPFYMIYWFYKHGEKIDKLNAVAGNKTDNTTMYLLLGIFIPVVACILMQDNINKLCTTEAYVAPTTNSEVSVSVPAKDEKNIAEALKEYKSLLDMGIITQEEFDVKKKQLLGL